MAGEFPRFFNRELVHQESSSQGLITTNLVKYVWYVPSQKLPNPVNKTQFEKEVKDRRNIAKIKEMKHWVCQGFVPVRYFRYTYTNL